MSFAIDPNLVLIFLLSLAFTPFLRTIFRGGTDPETNLPHKKLASLALAFTLFGLLGMFPLTMFWVGMPHTSELISSSDQTRENALEAELEVRRKTLEESLEGKPDAETMLDRFDRESDKLRTAFWNENSKYTHERQNTLRNVKERHEAKRQEIAVLPAFFAAGVGLSLLFLAMPGMIFGWWYLHGIRKAPEKNRWLRAMLAALPLPGLALFFGPVLVVSVAVSSRFHGTVYEETMGYFSVLSGVCLGVAFTALLIWRTYRYVFPVVPSPLRRLVWGWAFFLVGLIVLCLSGFASEQFSRTIYRLESDEYRQISNTDSFDSATKKQLHGEIERNRNAALFFIVLFFAPLMIAGAVLPFAATALGWRHLLEIRKTPEKPGLLPGLLLAWLLPGSAVVALCVGIGMLLFVPFLYGDWGKQQQFVSSLALSVGGLLGLCLTVYVARKIAVWHYAWFRIG